MEPNPLPTGSWTHSFEEDESGNVLVYRPTDSFSFPPARRGRDAIVFDAGGAMSQLTPGPDDRPRNAGSWKPLGMNRFAAIGGASPGATIEIVQFTPGVLKIRKL
jgi:hypothetical protein